MPRTPGIRREFRFPWRNRRQVAEDVDAELAFHLARRAEELVAAGLSADDARREAARRFGDLEYTTRYCRDEDVRRERESHHMVKLEALRQDLVYALRALRSAPGFAVVALLTLALGIGANTAIFSVVRGVLLRPLPFPDADRVVRIWHASAADNDYRSPLSEPDFKDWSAAASRFTSLAGYWYAPGGSGADLTGVGTPERLEGAFVTPEFFPTLRAAALVGRTIRPDEAVQGNDLYMVISYGLWQRRFGGDPVVVGRPLTINGVPRTVLGVMPPDFTYPADRIDFWIPLSTIPATAIGRGRVSRFLDVIGRLKPGVTVAQGRDELAAIARRIAAREPADKNFTGVTVVPVREAILGPVERPLLLLLGAVAFVLLITCVNIAGLLLARATSRERELAVRSALGAGRGRIVRQLLTESLVLAFLGGTLGVGLAYLGVHALGAIGAAELPRASEIRIDATVLLYALGVSMAAGLLSGVLPALRAASRNLQGMLRAGARGSVGAGHRLRGALVIGEVALAAILAVGAGLATRSFAHLLNVDPGFRPEHLLTVKLSIPSSYFDADRAQAYYQEILARVGAVPGVRAVGSAKYLPLRGTGEPWPSLIVPGTVGGPGDREIRLPVLHVSAGYFHAMGIPVRAGRTFTTADDGKHPVVLVVNQEFVRRYWPAGWDAGRVLRAGDTPIQIIGVVGNVRQRSLTEPAEPMGYIHYLQNMRSGMNLAIRTAGDPLYYVNAVRQAIWSVDPRQTITSIEPMSAVLGDTVARPRLLTSLLLLFGAMGLALGALGLYGVLSYTVSQRRQEIGVRVALGATPGSVLALVVRQGMTPALVGVVAGIAGALLLTRLMAAVLYQVRTTDPATFAAVVLVLLGTALLASWLPARRALRIDPVQALRYE